MFCECSLYSLADNFGYYDVYILVAMFTLPLFTSRTVDLHSNERSQWLYGMSTLSVLTVYNDFAIILIE